MVTTDRVRWRLACFTRNWVKRRPYLFRSVVSPTADKRTGCTSLPVKWPLSVISYIAAASRYSQSAIDYRKINNLYIAYV